MTNVSPEAAFCRMIDSLGDYRREVVIIGGWASQMYHFHPKALPQPDKPLMTTDADVYLRNALLHYQPKIDARLKSAGFDEELMGEVSPPVSKYHFPESKGFYVEFLTETTGDGLKADGSPDVTAGIEGVTAQKLDHLDLARLQPWEVGPIDHPDYPWPHGVTIKIINPASYIAQKILVHPRRLAQAKGDKDLLYVYDTIIRFVDQIPDLQAIWQAMKVPQILPGNHVPTTMLIDPHVARLHANRAKYFESPVATHYQAAALTKAAGRNVQPPADEILAVLQAGLSQIFAD